MIFVENLCCPWKEPFCGSCLAALSAQASCGVAAILLLLAVDGALFMLKLWPVSYRMHCLRPFFCPDNGRGTARGTGLASSAPVIDSSPGGSAAAISSHTKYHVMLNTSAAGDAPNYVRVEIKCAGASNQ